MNDSILHLGLIDDEAILLDAAALELAALDHPGADLDDYGELLATIADRLATEGGDAHSSVARATLLARVIADAFGFTGDRDSYDDPANADMIRVIDRRRGLPVTLAILYVAAARRLGWPAAALNTPGHVLVRIGDGRSAVLVDPFNDGALVEPRQLAALLAQAPASGEPATAMSNRAILTRLLLNEATRAERSGDPGRALTLYARMTTIAPAGGHAWWERARLELAHDDVPAARASLSAMLEMTRDVATRANIAEALQNLAGAER